MARGPCQLRNPNRESEKGHAWGMFNGKHGWVGLRCSWCGRVDAQLVTTDAP